MHCLPSIVKPILQEHVNPPGVLEQIPLVLRTSPGLLADAM